VWETIQPFRHQEWVTLPMAGENRLILVTMSSEQNHAQLTSSSFICFIRPKWWCLGESPISQARGGVIVRSWAYVFWAVFGPHPRRNGCAIWTSDAINAVLQSSSDCDVDAVIRCCALLRLDPPIIASSYNSTKTSWTSLHHSHLHSFTHYHPHLKYDKERPQFPPQ